MLKNISPTLSLLERENELWEMERRHKQENHQLLKQELREAFHMQRHQMQARHQMVSNITLSMLALALFVSLFHNIGIRSTDEARYDSYGRARGTALV